MSHAIIFRQLFEEISHTYTYVLGCRATGKALLIDPVRETAERDVKQVRELRLEPLYGLNTHVHADHVTGTGLLKERFPGLSSVLSAQSGGRADKFVNDGDAIRVGHLELEVRSTPGHTNGCLTFVSHDMKAAFTGDALLIRGCGRTDFQQGDAAKLYDSIHGKIFTLPDDYLIYPGHDYQGLSVSTVAEEKQFNSRLRLAKPDFIVHMEDLNLPFPAQIEAAVPSNLRCGVTD